MPILLSILSSRASQIVLALLAGYIYGWAVTDSRWRQLLSAEKAQMEAKYQAELRRQAQNAVEIAKAATQRVEEDAAELARLQKQVDDFDKGETHAKDPCLIDDAFHAAAGKLRQPAKPARPAKTTRPAK